MTGALTGRQEQALKEFRAFTDRHIAPHADTWHRTQRTPPEVIRLLADEGLLGIHVAREYGGQGCDAVTLGLLAGELGRGCSSVRSLLTVHSMVAHAVARWGSRELKQGLLPRLARGERVAALAVSEPGAGSDAAAVTTRVERDGDAYVVTGHKKWITYGESAEVFLVVGRSAEGPTALLIDRDTPGLTTELIEDMIGIRASMTAHVRLDGCRVPAGRLLARPGLGVSHVVGAALDLGRYTVGWGCVGILDAALEASVDYAGRREQFGSLLRDHQLVRRLISDMYTQAHAARLMCLEAGRLRDERDPGALAATSTAKYFAATAAGRAATDAVQLHGANGCSSDYPVQRLLGDSRVMEIIEGSAQLHQVGLAEYAFQERTSRSER
ncbi:MULTISPECIES: acyl-CoA dehydrogenase family protein [Streptomyces]|uniref:acyl-CoA dehydrogenase family protein n=1 Tax=Streptomyces TaxID=1883 RepID=UPI0015875790|nr:acyl-CoA dehydrogenase [Streptomyces sp. KAI-27]NUV48188.1 acyl-CoA dehydrogenase [Streptomyces sp. CAI-78]WTC06193.1 acyl-CoA dehydrogenase family protein [Streptomyces albidoflavus]